MRIKNLMNELPKDYKKQLQEKIRKHQELVRNKRTIKPDEKFVKKTNIFQKAASFGQSMVSRGVSNKKAEPETKQLRSLSCHGDENLPPCSERKDSALFPGSFYCGACGCGDKKGTQLVNLSIEGGESYSKLDYPKVSCPLKMPGFSTYIPYEAGVSENPRKKEIENRHSVEYIKQHST